MMNDEEIAKIKQDHAVAYFRGEMALDCPEHYTLEEKKQIYDEMVSSTNAVEEAIRNDFKTLSPDTQKRVLEMLLNSGVETADFWSRLLLGTNVAHP